MSRPQPMRAWLALALAGWLLAVAPSARAWDWGDVSVGGFLKSTNVSVQPSAVNSGAGFYSYNEQRAVLNGAPGEGVGYEVAVENELTLSDSPVEWISRYRPRDVNRRLDMDSTLEDDRYQRDVVEVDRLMFSLRGEDDELSLGRQAVGFGRMALVSPLDVVQPFSPDALDTDTRVGVDAVRATHYFGLGGQVGGTVVLGDDDSDNSYLATGSYNIAGVDMLGMVGRLRSRDLVGAGLAGDVRGVGLKAEFVQYRGRRRTDAPGDLYDSFPIAGIEAWSRFDNGLELLAEYLYNGAGAGSPDGYAAALASAAMQEGMTSLAGRQYVLIRPSYELHPLVTLQVLGIWNLEDQSALIRPELDVSLSDDAQLQLFVGMNVGPGPRAVLFSGREPRSEFGSVDDYGGFSLKYYF